MRKIRIFGIIISVLWLNSCDTNEKRNENIVRKYIESSNKGDTAEIKKLLSNEFDSKSLILKRDLSEKSIKIEKERLVLDELKIIDKNTIRTIEHLEDIYSDFFKLEMPKYEINYFIANSKIISINLDLEVAKKEYNLSKKIKHMKIESSFNYWFSKTHPKYNNLDYLTENGLIEFLEIYSKLDSSEMKKYQLLFQ